MRRSLSSGRALRGPVGFQSALTPNCRWTDLELAGSWPHIGRENRHGKIGFEITSRSHPRATPRDAGNGGAEDTHRTCRGPPGADGHGLRADQRPGRSTTGDRGTSAARTVGSRQPGVCRCAVESEARQRRACATRCAAIAKPPAYNRCRALPRDRFGSRRSVRTTIAVRSPAASNRSTGICEARLARTLARTWRRRSCSCCRTAPSRNLPVRRQLSSRDTTRVRP